MKILHIAERLADQGGSEIYVRQLVNALSDGGHRVSCLVASRLESVPLQACVRPLTREVLRGELAGEKPDVIHLHGHGVDLPWIINTTAGRVPILVTMHDYRAVCPGGEKFFRKVEEVCPLRLTPRCLPNAYTKQCNRTRMPGGVIRDYIQTRRTRSAIERVQGVILASRRMRDRMKSEGIGVPMSVLPYFVPADLPEDRSPEDTAASVVFVGRLTQGKGLQHAIQALSMVKSPFRLEVFGDGPLRSRLEIQTRRLGIGGAVRFHGHRDRHHVLSSISVSRLVVVPSIWDEPFGIVGLEAGALGKPVVAFDSGAISEWLIHEKTGFLVERGDVAGFAGRAEQILGDARLREVLGSNARRSVRDRFSLSQHLKDLVGLYEKTAH